MRCDTGKLQAYLDQALSAPEQAAVESHLARCSRCREEVAHLRQQGSEVANHLRALDTMPEPGSSDTQALARFWKRARPAGRTAAPPAGMRRWRPAAIGLAAVILLAVLLSFAPIRQAAADFLGLFRVRKFAVIPIDPARLEQLAGMEDLVMAALGEPTVLRKAGTPQAAADAAAADAMAGFPVRSPTRLPSGAVLDSFTVQVGPAVRVDVRREQAQALLDAVGITEIKLPEAETFPVTADIAPVVSRVYRADRGTILLLQTPSPEVTLPAGIEPAQMGEALLLFLGMPPADARRVAREIDWTSTLVIPLPTNVAQFHEVTVDGVTGLLLEQSGAQSPGEPARILLWQRDGTIYVLAGDISPEQLLQMADSFR